MQWCPWTGWTEMPIAAWRRASALWAAGAAVRDRRRGPDRAAFREKFEKGIIGITPR